MDCIPLLPLLPLLPVVDKRARVIQGPHFEEGGGETYLCLLLFSLDCLSPRGKERGGGDWAWQDEEVGKKGVVRRRHRSKPLGGRVEIEGAAERKGSPSL